MIKFYVLLFKKIFFSEKDGMIVEDFFDRPIVNVILEGRSKYTLTMSLLRNVQNDDFDKKVISKPLESVLTS